MSEVKRVSSKEILERAEIGSGKTLTRWYSEHRLIPPPDIDTHPSGRGKMAYWPAWVLPRCIRIRQLLKSGHSLDDIRGMLGTDWSAEARRSSRQYSYTAVSKELEKHAAIENFVEAVLRELPPGMLRAPQRDAEQITEWLLNRKTIEHLLDLMDRGYNPVLVLDGDSRYIVPDFVVGQMLAKAAVMGGHWWVAALCGPAYEAFKTVVADLDAMPRVRPVARIVEYEENGTVEQAIQLVGPFDFELVGRRVRKKKKA